MSLEESSEPWQDGGASADAVVLTDVDAAADPESLDASVAGSSDPVLEPYELCDTLQIATDGRDANLRATPDTSQEPITSLANGSLVKVLGMISGEEIDGINIWYRIETDVIQGYLFSTLARCAPANPNDQFEGFYLPLRCGKSARVSQGNFGSYSHQGLSKYAYDFALGIGTPMVAMAPGEVSYVYDHTKPGHACYDGGGPSCIAKANQVRIRHPDGTQTLYAHLSKVNVSLGEKVSQGQTVGLSGQTGYSTGPHAHVARMRECCQSIQLKFADVAGGVPQTGQTVKSGNCP